MMERDYTPHELAMKKHKAKARVQAMQAFAGAVVAAAVLWTGIALEKIPEGHVGLRTGMVSGAFSQDLMKQGLGLDYTSRVRHLRANQVSIDANDIRPKDKDGALFKDMDITVFVRLNLDKPNDLVKFLRDTNDLSSSNGSYFAGVNMIRKEIPAAVIRATRQFSSAQIMDDQKKFEQTIVKELQSELNSKYPGVFVINDANAYSMLFNDNVEASIQANAAREAKARAMEIETQQQAQERNVLMARYKNLKDVSVTTGVSIDQILMHQQILAMSEANARPQYRAEPGKPAKAEQVMR